MVSRFLHGGLVAQWQGGSARDQRGLQGVCRRHFRQNEAIVRETCMEFKHKIVAILIIEHRYLRARLSSVGWPLAICLRQSGMPLTAAIGERFGKARKCPFKGQRFE